MSELEFEASFWGDCINTFDEEQKHYIYGRYMQLKRNGYSFDAGGKSVIDIGGGPVSLLLKCKNRAANCVVVDPLVDRYPVWVHDRYTAAGIDCRCFRGEALVSKEWLAFQQNHLNAVEADEAWIYNVLQHTDDPALIIKNALTVAKTLRIFEWIDIQPHEGHPHMLTALKLREWIDAAGAAPSAVTGTATLNESGCVGRAFWGVFTRR